jgi:hypothetical protein
VKQVYLKNKIKKGVIVRVKKSGGLVWTWKEEEGGGGVVFFFFSMLIPHRHTHGDEDAMLLKLATSPFLSQNVH